MSLSVFGVKELFETTSTKSSVLDWKMNGGGRKPKMSWGPKNEHETSAIRTI